MLELPRPLHLHLQNWAQARTRHQNPNLYLRFLGSERQQYILILISLSCERGRLTVFSTMGPGRFGGIAGCCCCSLVPGKREKGSMNFMDTILNKLDKIADILEELLEV